ncbi:RDD family protein [Bernardetia sp.]|uniref:RDD family protein n=1 Tax=Bernardetia sp. TaxID=1937974 RepID=UPI0025BA4468|nr:RDD family protein [Bernardetia sp.]
MANTLKLTEKQIHFLEENRKDPITGDGFSLGDTIVFCAECKSAFTKESWEYMGAKHCNQRRTLKNFPSTSALKLKKREVQNFEKADIGNRLGAFMFDIIIGGLLAFLVELGFKNVGFIIKNDMAMWFIFTLYMVFRDIFTLKGSLGKKIFGLYFVSSKKEKKPIYVQIFFRNLIYWIPVFLLFTLFFIRPRNNDFLMITAMISLLVVGIFNVFVYPLSFLIGKRSIIDSLLKIKLLQKKEC